ncbi:hypothetical protein SAMN05428642_101639 [Flaviramulus basaltis]|uniref:Uncharacterized protein n=1 Tax=Flaviramulus basaltis TaxID=369401 RepID=A0A1K2IC06_9FLAO|nr:hypothetical protein [Flaviramulus basaltis]SFZ89921.1 hypothetical protein SAMN05428642_101639 [Flaviramulus basaltis]
MKIRFSILILICSFTNIFSQEKISEFKNDISDPKFLTKEVIPVVNETTDDLALFFMTPKEVYGYLLNNRLEVVNKLTSEDKRRKYSKLIGYSIKDSTNYNLYLTNKNNNKYAAISFSFDDKSSSINEFEPKGLYERFVQTVTINNIFYLITIIKETSTLNFYTSDGIKFNEPFKLNLTSESFLNRKNKKVSLYNLFTVKSNGGIKSSDVQKIDGDSPSSIEITSEETKLYTRNDKLVFTFDNNRDITQILTIDPINNYSYNVKLFKKPLENLKHSEKQSNSFINDSILFTTTATKSVLVLNIENYNSGKLLKRFTINDKDSITFKNTPIIQEGGFYDNYRELEGSQKFLRKVNSADIGVSAYSHNDNHVVTLGSKKEIKGGGMMMPMGGFGGFPLATIGSANVFFNPTFFAYNSYSNTKSVQFKSLLDSRYQHIKGEIEDNIFDKIKNHEEPDNLNEAKTIFKYKDYFILGNYIPKTKTYILKKFKD